EELSVITREIVIGASHHGACIEQSHLEPAETFLTAPIRERDQRLHRHATLYSVDQRRFDSLVIETEDHDVDVLPRLLDRLHQAFGAIIRLHKKFQALTSLHKGDDQRKDPVSCAPRTNNLEAM